MTLRQWEKQIFLLQEKFVKIKKTLLVHPQGWRLPLTKRQNRRLLQAGISLLEVMLSLSIVSVILVMATRYYMQASDNEKLNDTRNQVSAIMAAAMAWKSNSPNYAGISVNTLLSADYLPQTVSISGGKLYNPWVQPIEIQAVDTQGTNASITTTLPNDGLCDALQKSFAGASCDGQASGKPTAGKNFYVQLYYSQTT